MRRAYRPARFIFIFHILHIGIVTPGDVTLIHALKIGGCISAALWQSQIHTLAKVALAGHYSINSAAGVLVQWK